MSPAKNFKYFAFDAYGTLFDVHSAVAQHKDLVGGDNARLSEIWRNKQLEYTWTLSAMGQYQDFWTLTEQALDYAFNAVPGTNRQAKDRLLSAYESLTCYPEVLPVLTQLKASGAKTAILSNGSPQMLEKAVEAAGIGEHLDEILSVDSIRIFKTFPAVYQMVCDTWRIEPEQVSFQSSNRWDIAGASAFGFYCNWINRSGQPDEYREHSPNVIFDDLGGLI